MTQAPASQPFQAEVQELLDLMIHSLYTHEEIFLRELVSNASDALDKLRHAALTEPGLVGEGEELAVRLEADADARTLTVADNGVGMNEEDLVRNLGTIASSGTRRFLSELRERGEEQRPELIGQFGVGFYSAFIVAEKVVVETRRAGDDAGWRWTSEGRGSFSIEPCPEAERGTRITLHLREPAEGGADYTQEWTLRELVRRYSDFVEYPIRLGDDTLNSQKPIWTRPRGEITEEEHAEFYRHLTRDFQAPARTIHFKAEGGLEYTALLYVPSHRPLDLMGGGQEPRSRISLYVRRVQVSEECEDLLPSWLRFVRGVVEASDLPLNVSREILQANPHVRAIQKRLVKKVLSTLEEWLEKDRAGYEAFWESFGPVLKEGLCQPNEEKERLARLCLFRSEQMAGCSTLAEYVERMGEGQEELLYLLGAGAASLESSPLLEAFEARGWDVLQLTDPIDEWLVDALPEFDGRRLRSVHDASLDLGGDPAALEERTKELEGLLGALKEHYGEAVEAVRLSSRLTESPAVLVDEGGAPRPHLERMMRELHGHDAPRRRVLELNADHPLVERLRARHAAGESLADPADLLLGQVLLSEGAPLPDPARFARLVTGLMVAAEGEA
jgi:molecular chaperone HtpG